MISPTIISRILSDRSLTESQKADSIYGIVQDAFIDGYSIGTEKLISTIRDREKVITDHTPFDPQPGDTVVANYNFCFGNGIEFLYCREYRIHSLDNDKVTVFIDVSRKPVFVSFDRPQFFKHFSKLKK
jgi:hypothetical protein